MQNKKHYFVIVNYNSGDNIIKCIESILHSEKINPQIVIVDNASRDNSLETCKLKFPNLTYIYNTHNIGFGAGANIGTKFALEREASTITFCNPDAFIDTSCAEQLISTVLSGEADVVSPVIYKYNSDEVWFGGGKISFYKMRATHIFSVDSSKKDTLLNTDYISGCVMTVSAKVFEKIESFDEQFFLYYEDTDFSVRAKEAGFKLKVLTSAKAFHKEVSETENSQKTYFLVLSGLLFFNKHSHGIHKTYFKLHSFLRKIKNNSDLKKDKPLSQQIHKAFLDYDKKK